MACSEHVTGMQTNFSHTPQACDTCICGKQTHQPVPKLCEGGKATRRLGRVFVDLTGLQSVISHSGCSYIMNIIDDYSSYHWTRPLKAKSEAARELCKWLLAAENQSGKKLCYLVTDNRELRLNEVERWCAENGITHHFTVPHTSAQNGHVKRLHRTLMNKAQAMHLSCNAPLHLWDEFILISGTNLKITTKSVESMLIGYTSNAKAYRCWF
jgi:transposase InsO family protein